MSYARSPRLVCSTTMGTNMSFLLLSQMPAYSFLVRCIQASSDDYDFIRQAESQHVVVESPAFSCSEFDFSAGTIRNPWSGFLGLSGADCSYPLQFGQSPPRCPRP